MGMKLFEAAFTILTCKCAVPLAGSKKPAW